MQTMDSGLCGHKISRTLMEAFLQSWCDRGWPHARVFDFGILPGTGSIRAASVKSTGQGGGVSAAIWVNRRIHGRIQTCHCIVHRASFAGSICHTPPPSKAPCGCGFYAQFQVRMLCKKELRANSGEFVPWRPTTYRYSESTIVCCWYLVPGTAAAAAAAAGLADRGRTVLPTGTQQVFGIQVPGTLLVPGTRYRTPYVQDCCYCSGTVNHHSFRIVWSKN